MTIRTRYISSVVLSCFVTSFTGVAIMASITTDLPSTHRLHTGSSPVLLSKQLPSYCLTYYTDYCASYCRSYCLNCIPTITHMKCYWSYCRYYRSYYWSCNSTHCRQNRLSDEPSKSGESESKREHKTESGYKARSTKRCSA